MLLPSRGIIVTLRIVVCLVTVCLLASNVHAQGQTEKGAGLGGVAGAIIGGIIGNQNDQAPEGALIGGAIGAITGASIGNSRDEEIRRAQAYQWQQQQQFHAQQKYQQQLQRAIGMNDVISLSRSGVSESVIISQIQSGGVTSRIGVPEIISLHQQGVSENVINAMQRAPLAGEIIAARPQVSPVVVAPAPAPSTRVIIQPRPVVLQRYHIEPPCPHVAPYYRSSRHHFHFHH